MRKAAPATRCLPVPSAFADVALFDQNVDGLRELVKLRRSLVDPAITCGDGAKQGLETCDAGNTAGGDGCSARCRAEP